MTLPNSYWTVLLLCASVRRTASASSSSSFVPQVPWGVVGSKSSFLQKQSRLFWSIRGGEAASSLPTPQQEEELSLDDKVKAAMKKLGLTPPDADQGNDDDASSAASCCEGGVCTVPDSETKLTTTETKALAEETVVEADEEPPQDPHEIAARIAKELGVDDALAWAALGATATPVVDGAQQRRFDEAAAREMIRQELVFIERVSEDSEEVQQLVSEGHDVFLVKRALAFAEMNVDDARAILEADQMDADDEEAQAEKKEAPAPAMPPPETLKTVTVNADFDPTKPASPPAAPQQQQQQQQAPKPAKREDVIFDATSEQIQDLVIESPVPVLVDVYADWCGPCKALGPALEEMAIKAGGMFRLVKINSDNERAVSGALEVTALPTVFGIKDGKIVNMFQGMPRSEEAMKNFMMGLLMPGANFDPPVTAEERQKFAVLSTKLMKTAGAATFSFSARERLQDRTASLLDQLVVERDDNMADAEESAKVVRSLLSNVIRDPFEPKFRRVNLQNKVLAAKVAAFPSCLSILKCAGFVMDRSDKSAMVLGKDKKVVNIAPLTVARDCIDKWIDRNRQKIAAAARKRRDDLERHRLKEEAERAKDDEEDEEDEEEFEVDPHAVSIKLRIEGKKKVHELNMRAHDPLRRILDYLPVDVDDGEEIQLTCVAKRLVVKSSDDVAMETSLKDHGLVPTASIVVKIGDGSSSASSRQANGESSSSSSGGGGLKERAAAQKNKRKGSHTMQSVGIYGKDDNAKGELVDGGGGVLYEQDVTDDEDEGEEPELSAISEGSSDDTKDLQEDE